MKHPASHFLRSQPSAAGKNQASQKTFAASKLVKVSVRRKHCLQSLVKPRARMGCRDPPWISLEIYTCRSATRETMIRNRTSRGGKFGRTLLCMAKHGKILARTGHAPGSGACKCNTFCPRSRTQRAWNWSRKSRGTLQQRGNGRPEAERVRPGAVELATGNSGKNLFEPVLGWFCRGTKGKTRGTKSPYLSLGSLLKICK